MNSGFEYHIINSCITIEGVNNAAKSISATIFSYIKAH